MLITAAEERKKGMTALYIDGEYALSVDTLTLASRGFKAGSEITDEELYELIEASKVNRAKEKALYLIEYRSRTAKDLRDKLVPLFGEDAADAAIERLESLGLIDDERFARDYAEQLIRNKHFSRQRAAFELMKKGIDRDTADAVLDEMEADPTDQIRTLLETKYSRVPKDEKGRNRIVNSLRSMGYGWSDIRNAMKDYCDDDE